MPWPVEPGECCTDTGRIFVRLVRFVSTHSLVLQGRREKRTDNTVDTGVNQVKQGVSAVLGLDQNRGTFDDGIDSLEASSSHSLARFCTQLAYIQPR